MNAARFAIPSTDGRTFTFAAGTSLRTVRGCLRQLGYRLVSGERGRATAQPLH